jgi:hypothetical protein
MQKEQHRQVVTALPRMVYTGARRLRVAAMQQADRTAVQASGLAGMAGHHRTELTE